MAEYAPGSRAAGESLRRFRMAYAEHRAAEGRGLGGAAELLALPYVRRGPQAGQWAVRARSYERFVSAVLEPCARRGGRRRLHVLDLGAGNGWLSYRVARAGHRATAVDFRADTVDGLAAGGVYLRHLEDRPMMRVAGSFDALPLRSGVADIALFNASLHYALSLGDVLREAGRVVRGGGRMVIMDSPFYASAEQGEAMVAEKRREATARFGDRAADLLRPDFVEYLTPARLESVSSDLGLEWRRRRVRYPLSYELRPITARLRGRRPPSRFDLWEAVVP